MTKTSSTDSRKGYSNPNFRHGFCTNGMWGRTYSRWQAMKRRCVINDVRVRKYYINKGITVCARWEHSYINFLNDMGECPDGMTLERIDNSLGYSPGNCRWATPYEQSRNKNSNRNLRFNGNTMCLNDWAKAIGISKSGLRYRLSHGMSIKDALETPVMSRHAAAKGKRK